VSRLLDSILNLDWPKESLEIIILDDSIDETSQIIDRKIAGKDNTRVIRRENRRGYKAGALQYGLNQTTAEYIVIFDSDFTPKSDYLKKVVPLLETNKKIGIVQTRWGHINRNFNPLTKAVSLALDWHHHIEQVGRDAANLFINFNGSCGVMRRKAIIEAGNWGSDTLSEDLDISYRIQMMNWKAVYHRNVVVLGEIPPNIEDYRTQQKRWAKGSIQCSRKLLSKVLRSEIKLRQKIQAILHLNGYSVYLWTLLLMIFSVPTLIIEQKTDIPMNNSLGIFGILGILSQIAIFSALLKKEKKPLLQFSSDFILLVITSIGLSLDCSIAVIEGLFTKGGQFLRTPKYNITKEKHKKVKNKGKSPNYVIGEILLTVYSIIGAIISILIHNWGMFIYFSFHCLGFITVILFSITPKLFQP
jgi:cellulose synthase/poly-beta-1,6-N-acetylglucosamine synthase-like glycosyltransferase